MQHQVVSMQQPKVAEVQNVTATIPHHQAAHPVPTVVTDADTNPDTMVYRNFSKDSASALGAVQITIGTLSILIHISALVVVAHNSRIGHGIWCGLFTILVGILAIITGKRRTGNLINALMACSIISALMSVFMMSFSANGVQQDNYRSCVFGYCVYLSGPDEEKTRNVRVAINATLVTFALAEITMAIWASALCCSAVCCGAHSNQIPGTPQPQPYVTVVSAQHHHVPMAQPYNAMMQPLPGQPIPGQMMTGQPIPVQMVTGQHIPGQMVTGQPLPEQALHAADKTNTPPGPYTQNTAPAGHTL